MLIVIVIIGILTAAIIPRLNSARGRANDVARKADLNQVATALITYQLDTGKFPTTGGTIDIIEKELREWWMTSIPKDPANNSTFSGINGITEWQDSSYYLYTPIKKNWIISGGFILMAQIESHGQANYLICGDSDIINKPNRDDYANIELCSTIKPVSDETVCSNNWGNCEFYEKNLSVLRYIYKY